MHHYRPWAGHRSHKNTQYGRHLDKLKKPPGPLLTELHSLLKRPAENIHCVNNEKWFQGNLIHCHWFLLKQIVPYQNQGKFTPIDVNIFLASNKHFTKSTVAIPWSGCSSTYKTQMLDFSKVCWVIPSHVHLLQGVSGWHKKENGSQYAWLPSKSTWRNFLN